MRHCLPIAQDQQFRDILSKIFWHQWILSSDAFEEHTLCFSKCEQSAVTHLAV